MKLLKRILWMPIGLTKGLLKLANDNARDIENKKRFPESIIDPNCSISIKTTISPNSRIFKKSTLNNCQINSYTYIGNNSFLQNVSVGKFCSIAKDSLIGLGAHPINHLSTSPLFYKKQNPLKIKLLKEDLEFKEYKTIGIGHDVWVGARVSIVDGVKIRTGAIIAAGAVVTKDIPPYAIAGGIPAKIIKYRFDENKIKELLASGWWEWDIQKILQYSNKNQ